MPALHHHHASEQDLLVTLLALAMSDLSSRSSAARAEGGDDPADRLRSFEMLSTLPVRSGAPLAG